MEHLDTLEETQLILDTLNMETTTMIIIREVEVIEVTGVAIFAKNQAIYRLIVPRNNKNLSEEEEVETREIKHLEEAKGDQNSLIMTHL